MVIPLLLGGIGLLLVVKKKPKVALSTNKQTSAQKIPPTPAQLSQSDHTQLTSPPIPTHPAAGSPPGSEGIQAAETGLRQVPVFGPLLATVVDAFSKAGKVKLTCVVTGQSAYAAPGSPGEQTGLNFAHGYPPHMDLPEWIKWDQDTEHVFVVTDDNQIDWEGKNAGSRTFWSSDTNKGNPVYYVQKSANLYFWLSGIPCPPGWKPEVKQLEAGGEILLDGTKLSAQFVATRNARFQKQDEANTALLLANTGNAVSTNIKQAALIGLRIRVPTENAGGPISTF